MTKLNKPIDIDEFLFNQLILDYMEVPPDKFQNFQSYKHEEIIEFIQDINLMLGKEIYFTESPASSLGIVMNIEKGTLIHLASLEKFSMNVIFSFLSNRIMISLKMILSKCQFKFCEDIDIKEVKSQLSDWFDKFNIPFKTDAKGRKNYPMDVKYTNLNCNSSSINNKVLIVRPNMEPEYLKEIYYGYKCETCLKVGCSEREILRHCNTHRPHSNKMRDYCQKVSRGFVLCKVNEKFKDLHFPDEKIKIQKGEEMEDKYFELVQLGERKCSILMNGNEENDYLQFKDIFQEEYQKLKLHKSKRTLLKKRKLLRFYLTEDDSSEYHFSLNCNGKTVRKIGELVGRIITICKKLKLEGYGKVFQNDESTIIDELLKELTWSKFTELIVDIVNENRVGLMRTILITLFKDYDPIRRKVKIKSFRRRIKNVRLLIFLFRMCLRWFSEFEDDNLNCEMLQQSLKDKCEISTLMGEIYYPMVNLRKKKKEVKSQFDEEYMSYIHASGWGYHLIGVYSLNLVLKRNEEEIKKIITNLKESCEYKEDGSVGFYFKLAEDGEIEVIEKAFNDISLLMIEMIMILNPGQLMMEEYLKLDLKEFKVKNEDGNNKDIIELICNGDEMNPLNLVLDREIFIVWYEIIRRLYYDNESDEGFLFNIKEGNFRDIIKDITNIELCQYLEEIQKCSLSKSEWLKILNCSWKLSGEGYIKGNFKNRKYATVFGNEYDEFAIKTNKKRKKEDDKKSKKNKTKRKKLEYEIVK